MRFRYPRFCFCITILPAATAKTGSRVLPNTKKECNANDSTVTLGQYEWRNNKQKKLFTICIQHSTWNRLKYTGQEEHGQRSLRMCQDEVRILKHAFEVLKIQKIGCTTTIHGLTKLILQNLVKMYKYDSI
jgi:hypothetical protein